MGTNLSTSITEIMPFLHPPPPPPPPPPSIAATAPAAPAAAAAIAAFMVRGIEMDNKSGQTCDILLSFGRSDSIRSDHLMEFRCDRRFPV
ncbi:unnamed protein product, partial [Onchocerca ochengi]|uniref:Uncharacterized protein n=1 Tax=Onchocerca ochengi TaxID=42157 RepID=A0A182ELF5_ONCOC